MQPASKHTRRYMYPDEQGSSPGTSEDENPITPKRRFASLDGFRDSISRRRELKKVISPHADTQLQPGQVRLIYFKHSKRPRKWPSKSTIDCSRHIFSLDNAPRFRALSYTCGPPYLEQRIEDGVLTLEEPTELLAESKCRVRCDGRHVLVYSNLHDALLQLRHNLRRDLWLWVDCLCIQQQDQEERASQVKQMHMIYTSADEVLVWLGKSLGLRHDVVWFIREFCDVATRLLDPSTGRIDDRYKDTGILDTSWHSILGITDFEEKLLDLMIFLKHSRYFNRLWILQEVALASKPSIMWYGRMENFNCVVYLVDYFQKAGWFRWLDDRLDEKNLYLPGEPWTALEGMRSSILRFQSSTFETSFWRLNTRTGVPLSRTTRSFFDFAELLHYSRSFSCSDPRDKIYALLGIASQLNQHEPLDIAPVDYTLKVEGLYTEVQKRILRETQCIDLLSFVGRSLQQSDPSLPSWVPDLRNSDDIKFAVEIYLQPQTVGPPPCLELEECQQSLFFDGAALCCMGACVDEVEYNYREPKGGRDRTYANWVQAHQATLDALFSIPGSSEGPSPLAIVLNTVLIGNLELQAGAKKDVSEEAYFDFAVYLILNHVYKGSSGDRSIACTIARCHQMSDSMKHWGIAGSLSSRIQDLLAEVERVVSACNEPDEVRARFDEFQVKYDAPISRFVSWSKRVANTRVLVRTKKGLLASTQNPVEKGDQIFVLAGSRTANILRKTAKEDEYIFDGDCFIWHHQKGWQEEMSEVRKHVRPLRII
ncbi:hypothetical protein H2200_003149 [Cladophialophora chaetospira]|uniref:Heterokaryon incompatibility domain-containing protein n=1 Tax=Cladophialophora chaetospira TaxID=386627 RepID=A0AA38XGS8_9EURO|nr:hypothetical protein H2200_003149 [Cladophialophora chaetospira]